MSAGLVSPEASLICLQMVSFSLSRHFGPSVCICVLISYSLKDTHQIGLGPPVTSFYLRKVNEWKSLSCVWLLVTPCTVPRQAPLSVGFSRQEYWGGLPCPPQGDLPDPRIGLSSFLTPALQTDSLPLVPSGKTTASLFRLRKAGCIHLFPTSSSRSMK